MLTAIVSFGLLTVVAAAFPISTRTMTVVCACTFVITAGLQLASPPRLSSDYYRYLWQGRVSNDHGMNYKIKPWGSGSEKYNVDLIERMDWRDVQSVYPPLAEHYFRLHAAIFDSSALRTLSFEQRIAFSKLPNLILLVVSGLLVAYLGRSKWLGMAWALCPYVQFELINSAHIDALSITFILAAIYLIQKRTLRANLAAGVVLGLATITKLTPILLLAPILAYGYMHTKLKGAVACLIGISAVGLVSLPYFAADDYSLLRRIGYWSSGAESRFGNPIYELARHFDQGVAITVVRVIGLTVLALICLGMVRQTKRGGYSFEMLLKDSLLLSIVPIIASPIVLPWYWVAPLTLHVVGLAYTRQSKLAAYLPTLLIMLILAVQYIERVTIYTENFRLDVVYVTGSLIFVLIICILVKSLTARSDQIDETSPQRTIS